MSPPAQPRVAAPPDLVYTPGVPKAVRTAHPLNPAGPGCLRSPTAQDFLELLVRHLALATAGAVRLISEFWIPVSNARADLVVANGVLNGYEIKAPSDRLHRLPTLTNWLARNPNGAYSDRLVAQSLADELEAAFDPGVGSA